MNHARSTAMVSDDRLIMICVCEREGAEERERRGQCYRRKFHGFVVHVVDTDNKWALYLIIPLKSFLVAMEAASGHFSGMSAARSVPELTRNADIKLNPRVSLHDGRPAR
jgi:hypothetical protein